jgi:hypothetical protein
MPDGLAGLLVLLAALAPGAVYVQTIERYRPRRKSPEFRQIVELAAVGSATTAVAAFAYLAVISGVEAFFPDAFNSTKLSAFANSPIYTLATDWRSALFALASLALVLGASVSLAYLLARAFTAGQSARIRPGHGTWYEAMGVWQETHHIFVALEDKKGTIYSGYVRSVPLDDEDSAIILKGDMFKRTAQGDEHKVDQDYMVVPVNDLAVAGIELIPK